MDRISELPENVLLQILSLLPTVDVVATSFLSRKWRSLWKQVPRLKYFVRNDTDMSRFSRFVYWSLLLHKAPVLESFHLYLLERCDSSDIGVWISTAVDRYLRELIIRLPIEREATFRLPFIVYTCKTLVTLKLENSILVDVPLQVCLPSLKTLFLRGVTCGGGGTLDRVLSSCPVLEQLVVEYARSFPIRVPSLTCLSLRNIATHQGFVIDAPSLKYLDIDDLSNWFYSIESTPELMEAKVICKDADKFLASFTSVKRLSLYSGGSELVYPAHGTFDRLVHLDLDGFGDKCLSLLISLLEHSPKLRVLKVKQLYYGSSTKLERWNRPESVPECLLSSLETFELDVYYGTRVEKELFTYILKNAACLKKASISKLLYSDRWATDKEKFQMAKELAFTSRGSTSCEFMIQD